MHYQWSKGKSFEEESVMGYNETKMGCERPK